MYKGEFRDTGLPGNLISVALSKFRRLRIFYEYFELDSGSHRAQLKSYLNLLGKLVQD
jgi:hypothetical protein